MRASDRTCRQGGRWRAWALLGALQILAGCAQTPRVSVQPVGGQGGCALEPAQTILLLRQAGLTDPQVVQVGADLCNALARWGGAQITVNGRVEAILVANQTCVYLCCRKTGPSIYDLSQDIFLDRPALAASLRPSRSLCVAGATPSDTAPHVDPADPRLQGGLEVGAGEHAGSR